MKKVLGNKIGLQVILEQCGGLVDAIISASEKDLPVIGFLMTRKTGH